MSNAPICICGDQMIVRTSRESGRKFFGCRNYPQCDHTEAYEWEKTAEDRPADAPPATLFIVSNHALPFDGPVHALPGLSGRDIVSEIQRKREAAKNRKLRDRCLGTGACDCRRCR